MKPHERLFVAVGFLTMLLIGITMPTDPKIDGSPTWIDKVVVWVIIGFCVLWALRALRDMTHQRPRGSTRERYHHYDARRRKNK